MKRFRRYFQTSYPSPLLAGLLVIFAPTSLVHAQASSSITGMVSDPSGAPVPAVQVSARNLETGAVRNITTNDSGRYEILSLPVGRYEIKAAKPDFADSLRTGIELALGQEARIDFHLQVGSLNSEI